MTTGFYIANQVLYIDKDPEATLTYTLDWGTWLATNDYITAVVYTVQARSNDPEPLVKVTSDKTGSPATKTYITLSGGQADRTYTVFAKITTNGGSIEKRSFKVKVYTRSA